MRCLTRGAPRRRTGGWAALRRPTTLVVGEEDHMRVEAERFNAALLGTGWPTRIVLLPYAGDPSLVSPRTEEGRRAAAEILAAAERVQILSQFPETPRDLPRWR